MSLSGPLMDTGTAFRAEELVAHGQEARPYPDAMAKREAVEKPSVQRRSGRDRASLHDPE